MKTIGINKGLKKMIEEASEDGESVDMCISRLLDEVKSNNTVELDSTRTNIGVSEETFQRLNENKIFSTESHISVIYRLLKK